MYFNFDTQHFATLSRLNMSYGIPLTEEAANEIGYYHYEREDPDDSLFERVTVIKSNNKAYGVFRPTVETTERLTVLRQGDLFDVTNELTRRMNSLESDTPNDDAYSSALIDLIDDLVARVTALESP